MMAETDSYLVDALGRLGNRRRALMVALTDHRDRSVLAGDHQLGRVWNAIACKIADLLDEEAATIKRMEADLSPVVRPLTAEELAESDDDW